MSNYNKNLDKNDANFIPLTPLTFLERAKDIYPDYEALVYEDRSYTWLQVYKRCTKFASALEKIGIGEGDTVSVMACNTPEIFEAHYSIPMTGGVLNTINIRLDAKTVGYILDHSDAKVLIVDRQFHEVVKKALSTIKRKIIVIDINDKFADQSKLEKIGDLEYEKFLSTGDDSYVWKMPEDEWQAISLSYTSGTTGNPKGVILSHLNLLSDAMSISKWFQFNEKTRCLCMLPLFHNNGQITTLLAPLYSGSSTVVVRGKTNLFAFWFLINEYQITWTSLMSSILSVLLSFPEERKDDSLTGILCGGQILTRSVQEQFENKFHVPIFEGYGLTETTSFSCINGYPSEKRKLGSIGKPLSTNEMIILNEDDTKTAGDKEGEICIRGYNVAVGYVGDDNMNKAFAKGWFHSGDYGRKDKDGYFYFHGRQDSLIIKGGENVYPAEIENVLYTHPAIDECAVIGIPDKLLGENICAFIKIKDAVKLSEKELKIFCRDKIAYFKQPKIVL